MNGRFVCRRVRGDREESGSVDGDANSRKAITH